MNKAAMEAKDLGRLYGVLIEMGYRVIGPTPRNGAIVYDEISGIGDLPLGWTDEQEAGRYRATKQNGGKYFGYTVGLTPWKKFLHASVQTVWELKHNGKGWESVESSDGGPQKSAFLGVRPCELRAIEIQDQVKLQGTFKDFFYKKRRESAFLVVVNCTRAGGTCFCASMRTGPKAESGFDLALTEMQEGERHAFLIEAGSENGRQVLRSLRLEDASPEEIRNAEDAISRTAGQMRRSVDLDGLKETLQSSYDHPRWEATGRKCLTCSNCTMVCPTCFCTTLQESTDPGGEISQACRKWDSCFTMDFSYIHGGSIRASAKSRYRQWLTHKFASWVDQFGTAGCVGCGRCITWCPAGIDITAEVQAIRENPVGARRSI
jgi:sulfhydrogenase subunit beta (sulfur reductase)